MSLKLSLDKTVLAVQRSSRTIVTSPVECTFKNAPAPPVVFLCRN